MKIISLIFTLFIFYFPLISQPNILNYQGIARETDGNLISERDLKIEISILAGSESGTIEYKEEHETSTNDFGLFNIRIGTGMMKTGNLSQVAWGDNPHFIKTRIDLMDGNNYVDLGTSQLYSVPYALYASAAGSSEQGGSDEQTLSLVNNQLSIENGNTVDLSSLESEQPWQVVSNGISYDGQGISLTDESNGIKVRLSKLTENQGFISTSGTNGNDNVRISNLSDNPNAGFIAVADENGDTRSALYTDNSGTGVIYTNGANGNRNVNIGWLGNFPNNGLISVRDQEGNSQAGIYVDEDGLGRVFADVVDVPVTAGNQRSQPFLYSHLQGPEAAAYIRGTAQLSGGKCSVSFPEHFQNLIVEETLTIMITPLSASSRGIAVIEKGDQGFRVKELLEGTGTYSFDWEAKAVRKGFENRNLDFDPQALESKIDQELKPGN